MFVQFFVIITVCKRQFRWTIASNVYNFLPHWNELIWRDVFQKLCVVSFHLIWFYRLLILPYDYEFLFTLSLLIYQSCFQISFNFLQSGFFLSFHSVRLQNAVSILSYLLFESFDLHIIDSINLHNFIDSPSKICIRDFFLLFSLSPLSCVFFWRYRTAIR